MVRTPGSDPPPIGLSPVPSSAAVSQQMSRHPRRDTGPEMALRKLLHAAGYRYRVHYPVPGLSRRTMDVAFTKQRVAIFVDGCFWHGCTHHRGVPAANNAWWQVKLAKNVARDADTTAHLQELGWAVVRVWEHETSGEALERIESALRGDQR